MGKNLQDQGAGERAVRVAGHVGRDGGQRDGEADGLRVGQPEADQAAPGVGPGQVGEQGG